MKYWSIKKCECGDMPATSYKFGPGGVAMICLSCGKATKRLNDKEEAVEAWNNQEVITSKSWSKLYEMAKDIESDCDFETCKYSQSED